MLCHNTRGAVCVVSSRGTLHVVESSTQTVVSCCDTTHEVQCRVDTTHEVQCRVVSQHDTTVSCCVNSRGAVSCCVLNEVQCVLCPHEVHCTSLRS